MVFESRPRASKRRTSNSLGDSPASIATFLKASLSPRVNPPFPVSPASFLPNSIYSGSTNKIKANRRSAIAYAPASAIASVDVSLENNMNPADMPKHSANARAENKPPFAILPLQTPHVKGAIIQKRMRNIASPAVTPMYGKKATS